MAWSAALIILSTFAVSCFSSEDPLAAETQPSSSQLGDEEGTPAPAAPSSETHTGAVTGNSTTSPTTADAADSVPAANEQSAARPATLTSDAVDDGDWWAVVVAGASDPYDVLLADSVADLAAAGHIAEITNCDRGAAEALQMAADGTFTVGVHFESEQWASEAQAALASIGIEGIVTPITVACPK